MPFIVNEGVKIHYVVEGQGTPLVLIHGGFGSHQEWYMGRYVEFLKDNFQLIIADLRGHGGSDRLHNKEDYASRKFTRHIISCRFRSEPA